MSNRKAVPKEKQTFGPPFSHTTALYYTLFAYYTSYIAGCFYICYDNK